MRATTTLLILGAAFLLLTPATTGLLPTDQPDPALTPPAPEDFVERTRDGPYTDHLPIRIRSNDDFELPTAISGVTQGSGTPHDPYIIEGWDLTPLYIRWGPTGADDRGVACTPVNFNGIGFGVQRHAIEIVDTDAHVVIRNNWIHPYTLTDVGNIYVDSKFLIGILLKNADNVRIENNVLGQDDGEMLFRGVCARNVEDLVIEDNKIQHTVYHPLQVFDSQTVKINNNVITDSLGYLDNAEADGITVSSTDDLTIENNLVRDQARMGIRITWSPQAKILSNTVTDNGLHALGDREGISVTASWAALIQKNVVRNTPEEGIFVWDTNAVTVRWNNLEDNGVGVRSFGTELMAEENWWGCTGGPGNSGCDDVTGPVDYDPWLTSPVQDAGVQK